MAKKKKNKKGVKSKTKTKPAKTFNLSLKTFFYALTSGIIVGIASIPSYWIFGSLEPYAMFVIAGIVLGLLAFEISSALIAPVFYSIFAALIYPNIFTIDKYIDSVKNANIPFFYRDVISQHVYIDFLFPLVKSSSLELFGSTSLFFLSLLLSGFISLSTYWIKVNFDILEYIPVSLKKRFPLESSRIISSIFLAMFLLFISNSSFASMGAFRQRNNQVLLPGQYATDFHIYKRIYQLLLEGENFYLAFDRAIDEDARSIRESVNKKPEDPGAWPTPRWIRHPFTFYLWKYVGFWNANDILKFALLLVSISLFLVGLGFEKIFPKGAGIVTALFVFPFFFMATGWENLFIPDLWGSIFILLAFGCLLNNFVYPAIFFSLLASMNRIPYWLWIGAMLTGLFVDFIINKRWKYLAAQIAGFSLVYASFSYHWYLILNRYPFVLTTTKPKGGFNISLKWTGFQVVYERAAVISNYLIIPFTMHHFFGIWFILAGLTFFFLSAVLNFRNKEERKNLYVYIVPLAYVVFFLGSVVVQPHFSQYWGQHIMPLSLVGTSGLLLMPLRALIKKS